MSDSRDEDAVHAHFGLTYANYLVWNRTLMSAMPGEWQRRFVALADEFDAAWEHEDVADGFKVEAGSWEHPDELGNATLLRIGVTSALREWEKNHPEPDTADEVYDDWEAEYQRVSDDNEYFDANGNTVTGYVFVPGKDPVDHYRHPRKYTPHGA